jgi:hypothetical protein
MLMKSSACKCSSLPYSFCLFNDDSHHLRDHTTPILRFARTPQNRIDEAKSRSYASRKHNSLIQISKIQWPETFVPRRKAQILRLSRKRSIQIVSLTQMFPAIEAADPKTPDLPNRPTRTKDQSKPQKHKFRRQNTIFRTDPIPADSRQLQSPVPDSPYKPSDSSR